MYLTCIPSDAPIILFDDVTLLVDLSFFVVFSHQFVAACDAFASDNKMQMMDVAVQGSPFVFAKCVLSSASPSSKKDKKSHHLTLTALEEKETTCMW